MGKKKIDKKNTEFDDLVKNINTMYGANAIIKIGEDSITSIPTRSSGSILIDKILGGGYPKGRFIEIIGAEASGKAQPLSEPVLTAHGYDKMGNIGIGRQVITPDGNVTEVEGVYPQGIQDVYVVDFEDGSYVRATLDHLFTVYEEGSDLEKTLSTKELLDSPNRYYVKPTAPFTYNSDMSISMAEKYVNGVVRGDLRFDIYSDYLLVGVEERKALIHSILSQIVKINPTKYIVDSEDTKDLLMYLTKSLGKQISVRCFNTSKFEIEFISDKHNKNFIKDIYFDKREECQCIKVAHPSELYVTNYFIPTHNTTLALSAIAESQKEGEKVAYIDMEHSLNLKYAKDIGVNVEELYLSQPSHAEEALNIAERLIESGLFAYVVIDSVAALVPKKELEGESGDAVMGLQARLMSQACRKLTGPASKTNTNVIFINQLRQKIGIVWGSDIAVPGGNALKYYASQRLHIFKGKNIEDTKGEVIGHELRVKVIKNKIAPPFKEATTALIYGKGFDKAAEILNLAIEKDIVQRAGSWIKYNGDNLGQGFDNVASLINDNPELFEELSNQVL